MTKEQDFAFDLQLFAGGDASAAAGGAGAAAGGAGAAGAGAADGAGAAGGAGAADGAGASADGAGAAGGTILGGTGGEETPAAVPDAYDFKSIVPDGMDYDEASAAAFGEVAKKAGLSQEQASAIAAYGMQYMQQGVDAAVQAIRDTQATWAEEARAALGGDFEAQVAKAAAGRDALAAKIPGLVDMLNETGAGNRIEMIRLMAAVSELVGEDGGANGATGAEKSIYPNTDFRRYS